MKLTKKTCQQDVKVLIPAPHWEVSGLGLLSPLQREAFSRQRNSPRRGVRNGGQFQSSGASHPHNCPFSLSLSGHFCFFPCLYLLYILPPHFSVTISLSFPLCLCFVRLRGAVLEPDALPVSGCVILGKSHHLSEPQFAHV